MENYKNAYVTLAIMALNVLMFIEQFFFGDGLLEFGAMITARVIGDHEFYRIITSTFLHIGAQHLISNMLMLLVVGSLIENYMGHGLYAIMYIACGIAGNVASMIYEIARNVQYLSAGASGAIMGIVGYMLIWFIVNREMFKNNKSLLVRLVFLGMWMPKN